jgi:hypothetical protein
MAQSLTQEAWAILSLIRRYPGVPLYVIERDFRHIYNQIPRSLALLCERRLIAYRVEIKDDEERETISVLTFYAR